MQIELSRHAKRQMKWRHIEEEEIREAVNSPDSIEDSRHGRKNAYKEIGGRLLKVTYKHDEEKLIIITVMIKGR
jgi:hypothetical protein